MATLKKAVQKKVAALGRQDPRHRYGSMREVVKVFGIPMAILRWAKSEGCEAWLGGTGQVYLPDLLKWLCQNMVKKEGGTGGETVDEIDKRLLKAKADNEELKFLEDSKQLIRLDKAIEMVCEPMDIIRQELQTLPATQAALANPSDPVFAREALEEWRRGAMKSMNDKLEQLDPMRFSEEANDGDTG